MSCPLPTELVGVSVLIGRAELQAPLFFVSPSQINFQVPLALFDPVPWGEPSLLSMLL